MGDIFLEKINVDVIRPKYLLFFAIGSFAASKKGGRLTIPQRIFKDYHIIFLIMFILFLPIDFYISDKWYESILRYLILMTVFLGIDFDNDQYYYKLDKLQLIGILSYPIYLWHLIGRNVIIYIMPNSYNLIYYGVSISWVIVLLVILKRSKSNSMFRSLIGR